MVNFPSGSVDGSRSASQTGPPVGQHRQRPR